MYNRVFKIWGQRSIFTFQHLGRGDISEVASLKTHPPLTPSAARHSHILGNVGTSSLPLSAPLAAFA